MTPMNTFSLSCPFYPQTPLVAMGSYLELEKPLLTLSSRPTFYSPSSSAAGVILPKYRPIRSRLEARCVLAVALKGFRPIHVCGSNLVCQVPWPYKKLTHTYIQYALTLHHALRCELQHWPLYWRITSRTDRCCCDIYSQLTITIERKLFVHSSSFFC